MHNIRKIKRKKKTKIMNPQDLAQQKLFEISRFQDEQEGFNQVDIFIEKLQPKIMKMDSEIPAKSKIKAQNRTFVDFYSNEFEKSAKRHSQYRFESEMQSHSSEIIGKKPLSLINYILLDRRDRMGKTSMSNKTKADSLAKIKRKMNIKRSKSVEDPKLQECSGVTQGNTQSELFLNLPNHKKSGSPFQIKNVKLFTKYIAILPSVNS